MYQDIRKSHKSLIVRTLVEIKGINKWRKDFIVEILILFVSIKGRINFSQLGRYGNYGEQRYRQQFEKDFNFLKFNKQLISKHGSGQFAIAFDPSFISKSGKKTYGLGKYWSGCAQETKKGLEIGGLATIDIYNNTAFHLEAVQTPDKHFRDNQSYNLIDWYTKLITDRADELLLISRYVVADAYFSKEKFVREICDVSMHTISKLRKDADLRYLYKGEPTGKQGAPGKYDGKIIFKELNFDYFDIIEKNDEYTLLCAEVNSKALKRNIKLVIKILPNGKHHLYFSTHINQDGKLIYDIYRKRFHIEFIYRDGKQHTGLENCQARDENKLNFHFNASLTSINLAKITHWLSIDKEQRKAFSMADVKTLNHNILLLDKFIDVFAINPNSTINQKRVKERKLNNL